MSQYSQSGVVSMVSSKDFEGRNGWVKLWSFQLEGDRSYYRTGTDEPHIREGDNISFTYEQKGRNNNVKVRDIIAGGESTPVARRTSPPAGGGGRPPAKSGGGGNSRDDYWAKKEAKDVEKDQRYQTVDVPRMSFSAAQDRAVNLVSAALAHDCLSFGNMKKGEKLDYVLECVDNVTNQFFLQSMDSHERLKELRSGTSGLSTAAPSGPAQDSNEEFDYDE